MDRDPFDLVGEVIEGQFRVDSFAGEGDLSVVYKAHHLGVDAPVAIKILNLPTTLDPALVRPLVDSFKESSRVHYRLASGTVNIAQSIASGSTVLPRTGIAAPYLVREWFEGESLASDLTRRRVQLRAGRSIEEALQLLETAFEGVAYAHQQGEAHLAMNPSNLFLSKRGDAVRLRVLDFGIGSAMNEFAEGGAPAARPQGGLRVLFPAYAAPEQLDRSTGKPGLWTDVYALALVTMEVLSDRAVMAEQDTGALVKHALDPTRRPTPVAHGLNLARDLDLVLTRAVSLAPDRRQESAAVLWRDIQSAARVTTSRPAMDAAPAPAKTMRLVKVGAPPLPKRIDSPPQGTPSRPVTVMGMGSPWLAAGGAPGSSTPPIHTLPMAFEPIPAPEVASDTTAARAPASVSALSIAVNESPPEPLAPATPPAGLSLDLPPLPRTLLSGPHLAVVGAVAGTLVLAAGAVSLWPRHPAWAKGPVFAATTAVALVAADTAGTAAALPAVTPVDTPASAPTAAALSPPASEPAASASAEAATPTGPFAAFAARRALDATSRNVLGCRRGKLWGVAQAKVTFANDGSVSGVTAGAPFGGTPSGACVEGELSAAHVAPYSGKPGVVVYQFFVAPK